MGEVIHHDFGHPAPKLTKKQMARHLGRTTKWLENQVKKGLPSQIEPHDGRMQRLFPLIDCEHWLEQQHTKGDDGDGKAQFAVRG